MTTSLMVVVLIVPRGISTRERGNDQRQGMELR
jgi:hypothetical protein